MTVGRTGKNREAIMAIGIDQVGVGCAIHISYFMYHISMLIKIYGALTDQIIFFGCVPSVYEPCCRSQVE